jgi:protein gp37
MSKKDSGDWWKQGSFNGCWTFGTGCKHSALPPEKRRPGCAHCWACEFVKNGRMARVHSGETGVVAPYHKIIEHPERLEKPLKRKKRSVFTNIYVEWTDVREEYMREVLSVIERCPQHVFVLVTKEPEKAVGLFSRLMADYVTWESPERTTGVSVPENVILLASVWDQASTDEACAAFALSPVLWGLHVEPCLASVAIPRQAITAYLVSNDGRIVYRDDPGMASVGGVWHRPGCCWVVVGSENGPRARPFDLRWARDIQHQCKMAGVPYWFKNAHKQDVPEGMIVREVPW